MVRIFKFIAAGMVICFTLSACPNQSTSDRSSEITEEERVEEPQVRDGIPQGTIEDSLAAADTLDRADTLDGTVPGDDSLELR